MTNSEHNTYWNTRYEQGQTGWDIGYASPPIIEYFKQIDNKYFKILIPGAGKAWEAEFLFNNGFTNVFLLDFAAESVKEFKKRCPSFPDSQIIIDDFFNHEGQYDIIVEQTFFSAILPEKRNQYASKISSLLNKNGKLVGLLFNKEFPFQGPPFGGTAEEYRLIFSKYFEFLHFDTSFNSISPRNGNELFILLNKKQM